MSTRSRILIVRLPCRKVFPTGPLYLMSLLRRALPQASLKLLDLALVERAGRGRVMEEAIRRHSPDLLAFSWRDMQIFSPQDIDGGLRDAFIFFHGSSAWRRVAAAFRGLRDMVTYSSAIEENLGLIRGAARAHPVLEIALGGPSVKIFGDRLSGRLPRQVKVFPEAGLDPFFRHIGLSLPADPVEPSLDLEAVEGSFPQWPAYRDEVIGVQSKQGCPHSCLYCLYGFLEGKRVIRREPARVVSEMAGYARRWGARRFWFADAQLLSERGDHGHLAAILEGVEREGLQIQWGGYLRIHEVDHALARLMVRSGLADLEVSLNSGAQEVVDQLRLGFSVDQAMRGFHVLRESGYAGKVLVNISLNAPGETRDTLRRTLERLEEIRGIFGRDRVVPVVFFLAIQPHTGLESRAIAEGHIRKGYDPLSVRPANVLRLIYNPPPLGGIIGRSCARAFAAGGGSDVILRNISLEIGTRDA
jgi:Radical SAM superfamily